MEPGTSPASEFTRQARPSRVGAERFLAEIKLTAWLQHPNILPLFDSGAADGMLYYVMPYVRGETLRDKLNRERALDVDEAVTIARGIARALSVAGARRVTLTGTSVGTPHYMSPEQALGEDDIDRRTDVYALGCVLFEMLAGTAPFTGATAANVVAQHITAEVPSVHAVRTTVPPSVDDVIARAMARDRDARFATAAAMSPALAATPAVEPMPDYSQTAEPVVRSTAPLTGRRRELAELVGGEPGVGKTKLMEAVLLTARSRGYYCAVGHCYEMDGAPPYLPFMEQRLAQVLSAARRDAGRRTNNCRGVNGSSARGADSAARTRCRLPCLSFVVSVQAAVLGPPPLPGSKQWLVYACTTLRFRSTATALVRTRLARIPLASVVNLCTNG